MQAPAENLQGKTVVLIGAGGLLGSRFLGAILAAGGSVIAADKDATACEKALQTIDAIRGRSRVEVQPVDITSKASLESLIQFGVARFSKIDAMVNCAYPRGQNYGRKLFDVEYGDFCNTVNLHLGGYFLATQRFAKYFKDHGGGNIVNVSSIYGVIAPRFEIYEGTEMTMPVEYAAIKAGLIHLTKYTAKYLNGTGVRLNCLSPGGILNGQDQQFVANYRRHCQSKGMLDAEDLTGSLVYLLSDDSRYLNGQNLVVDDGFTL